MSLHPLYRELHRAINDAHASAALSELLEHNVFNWVAPYVVTDAGNILLQAIPKTRNRKKTLQLQSFGGSHLNQNSFFMFHKMRGELRDESSLTLTSAMPFRASSIYVVEGGLLQVIVVKDSWLREQRLWSPEWARNHCNALGISTSRSSGTPSWLVGRHGSG